MEECLQTRKKSIDERKKRCLAWEGKVQAAAKKWKSKKKGESKLGRREAEFPKDNNC